MTMLPPAIRPRVLTPEVQEFILAGIEAGQFLTRAIDLAGISRSAFFDWRAKGQAGDPDASDLDDFFRTLEKRDGLAEFRAPEAVISPESEDS